MTVGDALTAIRTGLFGVAGDCALSESEIVLETLLSKSRSELYLAGPKELPSQLDSRIQEIIARRQTGEPLAYILGTVYFHSRSFFVSPAVLIPRPDTETLVECVLTQEPDSPRRFLEIGVGSGAVLSILSLHRPQWHGSGTDLSGAALDIARKNCPPEASLVAADLFAPFKPGPWFDFIVSNPPYVSDREMDELDTQVRMFEPHEALRGGPDGLDYYRVIANEAFLYLKPEARVYCEIGANQKDSASEVFLQAGWRHVEVTSDLSGHPRVLVARDHHSPL